MYLLKKELGLRMLKLETYWRKRPYNNYACVAKVENLVENLFFLRI